MSKSHMLYEGEDFGVRLEYDKDYVIFHLPYVNKMTKGVLDHMRVFVGEWYEFFTDLGYNGVFAAVDPNDLKIKKLLAKLNFVYIDDHSGMSVYGYTERT